MSTALMQECMSRRGIAVGMLPALDYMRTLDNGEPDMAHIGTRLRRLLADNPGCDVYLTQGYICRNSHGGIDNLKRGGSDYTASLIGAVTDADEIQIWTDIDGMHNNDPRFVPDTAPVHELHFEEAAELAYFGAKILHPSCVLPAKLHNIPDGNGGELLEVVHYCLQPGVVVDSHAHTDFGSGHHVDCRPNSTIFP